MRIDGHLIVDHNSTIRAASGTLEFEGGLDWQCSGGVQQFVAATPASLLLFDSPFHADAGVTSLFGGPGTNRWVAGATINGTAQVGPIASNAQFFASGNLEVLDSLAGAGTLHVVGGSGQGGLVIWSQGTLGLAGVNVDAGASLVINGGQALSGCGLTNSGLCTLLGQGLLLAQGSVIRNTTAGTFEAQADATLSGAPADGGSVFDNAGTLLKSGNGTLRFGTAAPPAGLDLLNNGLVEVRAGQLNVFGGASGGEFRTAAGAVLWFWGGTNTLNAGAALTGLGSVRVLQGAAASQLAIEGDLAVAELEVGANAILQSPLNGTGTIPIQSLIADSNAVISNGTFVLASVQMGDSASFNGSTLSVSNSIAVGGSKLLAGRRRPDRPDRCSDDHQPGGRWRPGQPRAGGRLGVDLSRRLTARGWRSAAGQTGRAA